MLIGELALASGFSRDAIRYYEKRGLISTNEFSRDQNNYKNYSLKVLESLTQILQLKTLGFTLTEIVDLLKAFEGASSSCGDLPMKLNEKITLFDKKIALLEEYKYRLKLVEKACNGACDDEKGLPDCFDALER